MTNCILRNRKAFLSEIRQCHLIFYLGIQDCRLFSPHKRISKVRVKQELGLMIDSCRIRGALLLQNVGASEISQEPERRRSLHPDHYNCWSSGPNIKMEVTVGKLNAGFLLSALHSFLPKCSSIGLEVALSSCWMT